MAVDSCDNFSALILHFWVIEVRIAVTDRILTLLIFER